MSGCKFPFNAIKLLKIEVDLEQELKEFKGSFE